MNLSKTGSILLILVFLASCCSADVVYLNEGEEHVGSLIEVNDSFVRLLELNGVETKFPVASVAHILISKVRPGDEISRVASITEPLVVGVLQNLPESDRYTDSNYVTLFRRRTFTFNPDGSVDYLRREMILILKEPGLDRANRSIYYIGDREKIDLVFARTYSPEGAVYHVTDDAISEESLFSATPEYARLKLLKFAMKKVDLGSVIDIAYTISSLPPTSIRPYMIDVTFGEREPVLAEELVVNFPENVTLLYKQLQFDRENIPVFSQSHDQAAKTRNYTWKFSDPEGFIPEQNMPSTSRVFPRVIVYPQDSWENIAGEFKKSLEEAAPSKSVLGSFLVELDIDEALTETEKARKLHDAIIQRIRLINVSTFDMGGIDPVSVDTTIQKRYGNNLARVTLMYYALKAMGIESNIGFTASWRSGGVDDSIPNMGQVASAILRVRCDGEVFFTSCEADYMPFGHLLTSHQGSTGCFLINDTFVIKPLPDGLSENRFDQTVFAKLTTDGSFEVKDLRQYRGSFESGIRAIRSMREQEKRMFAERTVKRVHPTAVLTDFSLTNLDDMSAPAGFVIKYRIPNAALKASDRILAFRNFWVSYSSQSASLATRTYPLEYWGTEENTHNIVIEIPEGFKWVEWGRNYSFDAGYFKFFSNMNQTGNLLNFADRFTVSRKFYEPQTHYPVFRKGILTMSELANQWIILERDEDKKIESTPETSASASPPTGSGSVELVDDVNEVELVDDVDEVDEVDEVEVTE